MPKQATTQHAFRLPDRLVRRIDAHAKRMKAGQRDVEYTRTDAVRDLLTRALDEIEQAEGVTS